MIEFAISDWVQTRTQSPFNFHSPLFRMVWGFKKFWIFKGNRNIIRNIMSDTTGVCYWVKAFDIERNIKDHFIIKVHINWHLIVVWVRDGASTQIAQFQLLKLGLKVRTHTLWKEDSYTGTDMFYIWIILNVEKWTITHWWKASIKSSVWFDFPLIMRFNSE